jgi:hypothetical protein
MDFQPISPLLAKDTREQDASINYYPDLSTPDRVGQAKKNNEEVLKHFTSLKTHT